MNSSVNVSHAKTTKHFYVLSKDFFKEYLKYTRSIGLGGRGQSKKFVYKGRCILFEIFMGERFFNIYTLPTDRPTPPYGHA